jgi:hypothetical protein
MFGAQFEKSRRRLLATGHDELGKFGAGARREQAGSFNHLTLLPSISNPVARSSRTSANFHPPAASNGTHTTPPKSEGSSIDRADVEIVQLLDLSLKR